MTQPDARLADWIGEGPELAPPDLLGLVLDQVDQTPQGWPVWRWPRPAWTRPRIRRGVAIAAGALIVLAAVALPRLLATLPTHDPGMSASPIPSASPTPPALRVGPLDPGAYRMVPVGGDAPGMTLTVGDGWEGCCQSSAFAIQKGSETDPGMVGLSYWVVDRLYLDPCRHIPTGGPLGPSAADLATALWGMSGVDVTRPQPVRLAGRDGVYLELRVRQDIGCEPGAYTLWMVGRASRYAQATGELDRLWILNVNGQRVVVDAESQLRTRDSNRAALDRVVESIRFDEAGGR